MLKVELWLGGACMVALVVVIVVIAVVLAAITGPLSWLVRTYRQQRALLGISNSQRTLLKQLWQAELVQRRLNSSCRHENLDTGTQACAKGVLQDSRAITKQCHEVGIDDWRVSAYLIDTHDYWWCLASLDWFD